MKTIYAVIAILIGLIIIFTVLVDGIISDFNTEQSKMTEYVGNIYILQKDTLIVIDYNAISGIYILDDGTDKIKLKYKPNIGF